MTNSAVMERNTESIDFDDDEFSDDEMSDHDLEYDTQKDRYMTFLIGEQNYGIDIIDVTEIVGLHDIAEVPDVPAYVKGMINLRGSVIPAIDVRIRFGMEEREYDARTCVVVVTVRETAVGLIVDRVNEVAVFPESQISDPPQGGESNLTSEYITGLGKQDDHVTILLDTSRLINKDRVSA